MDFKWKIKADQLQEQLEAAQEHAAQLEQILDACEAANAKHLARIDHLESVYWRMWGENENLKHLCRDMYENIEVGGYISVYRQHLAEADFRERMTDLGLLDGEQND